MNPYIQKLQTGTHTGAVPRRARVEIVPLIDVMFLLVAFFMMVSISMVMQKGIFVDLSPAETADSSMEDEDTLVISVDAEGLFFLNKNQIEVHDLKPLLETKAMANKDTLVIINADRLSQHGKVIEALDLVRKAELHNVIFSVEPKE